MDSKLRNKEVQDFIETHLKSNLTKLAFQKNPFPEIPFPQIITQIETRQKAMLKLPSWVNKQGILYPKTSLEQSSSEPTARFKSQLIKGKSLIDLTGGLGIDSYFFAEQFESVIHVEPNAELQQIARENFEILGIKNIQFINQKAEDFLQTKWQADIVYLDPSRRNSQNQRVHFLEDCEPNIIEILPLIFQNSPTVLLKAAPMLDLKRALEQLIHVSKTWVIASDNEVKELLFKLEKEATLSMDIETINIQANQISTFCFNLDKESETQPDYTQPQKYLVEPNRAILKAGAFNGFAKEFGFQKLHPHTHLYTCTELPLTIEQIPGRVFEVLSHCKYRKKEIQKALKSKKVNIATRNFPDSPELIYKKLGLQAGGSIYLWGIKDSEDQLGILITQKAS
jgi:hypothetical protein